MKGKGWIKFAQGNPKHVSGKKDGKEKEREFVPISIKGPREIRKDLERGVRMGGGGC
jgi:hypothetical protein